MKIKVYILNKKIKRVVWYLLIQITSFLIYFLFNILNKFSETYFIFFYFKQVVSVFYRFLRFYIFYFKYVVTVILPSHDWHVSLKNF